MALVCAKRGVLARVESSQWALYHEFGGIHPGMAARSHKAQLTPVLNQLLTQVDDQRLPPLLGVAVTAGPGLAPCLWEGLNFAKEFAASHHVPLVAINHLEAHLHVPRLTDDSLSYPYLGLLISGGHTELCIVRGLGDHQVLGNTMDDAVGEAYDKVVRLLGVDSGNDPPGAVLERLASEVSSSPIEFPVPLRREISFDFSFSGLKAAVRRQVHVDTCNGTEALSHARQCEIAFAFQQAVLLHISRRLVHAFAWAKTHCPGISTLVLGGGVAANNAIFDHVSALSEHFSLKTIRPPRDLCGDNGVMIAWVGLQRLAACPSAVPDDIVAQARWGLGARVDQTQSAVEPELESAFKARYGEWRRRNRPPVWAPHNK